MRGNVAVLSRRDHTPFAAPSYLWAPTTRAPFAGCSPCFVMFGRQLRWEKRNAAPTAGILGKKDNCSDLHRFSIAAGLQIAGNPVKSIAKDLEADRHERRWNERFFACVFRLVR